MSPLKLLVPESTSAKLGFRKARVCLTEVTPFQSSSSLRQMQHTTVPGSAQNRSAQEHLHPQAGGLAAPIGSQSPLVLWHACFDHELTQGSIVRRLRKKNGPVC